MSDQLYKLAGAVLMLMSAYASIHLVWALVLVIGGAL